MRPFTPPKHGRLLVPATQYDDEEFERDSLASQSSRTSRVRLIGKWTVVMVKHKSECAKDEAIDAFKLYADDELAKAGSCDDVVPRKDGLGYFKRAHVSSTVVFPYFYFDSPNWINACLCRLTCRLRMPEPTASSTIVRTRTGVDA